MKSFEELMGKITKNVEYWSWWVSSRTRIEKEDAYQELLLIVWKEYCSRVSSGRPITKYFMQKRLHYASIRVVRNFYHSMASLTFAQLGENIEVVDERVEDNRRKEWINFIFDNLLKEKITDKRVKIIFCMLRQGYRNCEIAEIMNIKQNTLSIIITRKIKKAIEEEIEESPFSDIVYRNTFLGVYS